MRLRLAGPVGMMIKTESIMLHRSWLILLLILFAPLFANLASANSPATQPDELPRYKLHAGQQLTYRSSGSFNYQTGSMQNGTESIYRVVRQNADGSWHIIGQTRSWDVDNNQKQPEETSATAFDLTAGGTIRLDPAAQTDFEGGLPSEFPLLPASKADAAAGWHRDEGDGASADYKSAPATQPSTVRFAAVNTDTTDKIYLVTSQTEFTFDPSSGVMISADNHGTQDYGFHAKFGGVDSLVGENQLAADWIARYTKDCDIYFAALKTCEGKWAEAADADPGKIDQKLAEIQSILRKAHGEVSLPEIAVLLDKKLTDTNTDAAELKSEATDRAAVIGKPAPDWQLADLTGGDHALSDYRGKIVVLDFWYRGCGWCMKAMPQMKQLAADYKGKPVVILGMNTDQDAQDAKVVVSVYGLPYPILRTTMDTVPTQYHVEGYPAVFVIGPDGVVRDIRVGYSPTLHDDVGKKIDELLKG